MRHREITVYWLTILTVISTLVYTQQVTAIKFRDTNVILRTCSFNGSRECITDDPVTDYKPYIRLISGGISQLLFDQVQQITVLPNVTKQCQQSLSHVYELLLRGDDAAFRLIDSSAKMPSASLAGTVTDFGDYDECINIQESHLTGQYCMIDVLVERPRQAKAGLFQLGKYHYFNETARFFGICFPDTCTVQDVRVIISHLLRPFPVRVTGDIDCVSHETISYTNRLLSLTKGQMVSIVFLLTVAAFIALGTLNELITLIPIDSIRNYGIKEDSSVISSSLWSCSLIINGFELIAPYASSNRIPFVDYFKLTLVLAGVTAHILTCLETPLGFFVTQNHSKYDLVFGSSSLQFLLNDGGLGCLTFLSAYVAYNAFKSSIYRRVLRFHMAIFSRWTKFVPVIIAITALDFTWPLYSSGPFHWRVTRFTSDKCSANWWANIAFVSIFLPALDICAPHTYYASIDFITFCTGIFAIHLLVHSPRIGRIVCTAVAVTSFYAMYHYSGVYRVPPAILSPNTGPQQVINFLDVVQMSPFNYMSNFFFGLLIADLIDKGTLKLEFKSNFQHARYILLTLLVFFFTELLPGLYNSRSFVPESLIPLCILTNRVSFSVTIMLFVIYAASITSEQKDTCSDKSARETSKSPSNGVSTPQIKIKLLQLNLNTPGIKRVKQLFDGFLESLTSRAATALTRLSFAIYLSNYFFIRSDFFTSRFTFENSVVSLVRRLTASFPLIIITAVAFHLAFVAPSEKLRKKLFTIKVTRQEKTE